MDSILAEKIFRAYRTGLLRPRPLLEDRGQQFDLLFRQVFWFKVPLRERLPIWKIWKLSSTGLRLSRDQRLEEASKAFGDCWEELAKGRLSTRHALLAKTFVESCNAYFEHKRGAFDLARARTYNSMEADLSLEEDEDFSLLELHRIQSANNLMRIDLRSGEQDRALALAGEILAYLEGFREGLTVHHSWRSDLLHAKTPQSIRRALISQVANEAVLAFFYYPESGLEEVFLSSIRWEKFLAAERLLHPQFRLWLMTKQASSQKNWSQYFERLLEFLPTGRTDIQPVWYASIIDFLSLCRELNSRVSMYVHDGILRDVRKWPGLPASLRPALGLATDPSVTRMTPNFQAAGFSVSRSAAA